MKSTIKIGYIGLGQRGTGQLRLTLTMPDVEVAALCDVYPDRVQAGLALAREARPQTAVQGYTDYRELLARPDIDAVMVATSWQNHVPVAVDAMRTGKYVGLEVGGAASVEECWRLVRAYEETGVPCMLMENACYGREQLALVHMHKQGLFGELVHMEGAYAHDLREEITHGLEERHYRFQHFLHRDGSLYPTHPLGVIATLLSINRGNRFLTLTSMSSNARGLHDYVTRQRGENHEYAKLHWNQGDINSTLIKCANGQTIILKHDDSLVRLYSREYRFQGTHGMFGWDGDQLVLDDPREAIVAGREPKLMHLADELPRFDHPLWKQFASEGVRGGHGGKDYLTQRAFYECVMAATLPPIDVYDAAAWMSITALSEQSVAMGGMPVAIPDFTNGAWLHREPSEKSRYSLFDVHYDLF